MIPLIYITKTLTMKLLTLNLILLCSCIFFLSCGKDEVATKCTGQAMSGTFKGSAWTLETITNATILKGKDPTTGKTGYRLDIAATAKDGSKLTIIVNEFEKGIRGDCMDVTKNWSTKLFENYFDPIDFSVEIAIFILVDKNGNVFNTVGEDLDGNFKISKCDESGHKMSGTFNFNVNDEEGNEITFSNGKFENICFNVN